jgi:hypothetical protein
MRLMIFLLMCFSAYAQTFQYRAEGSFQTRTQNTVNYSVNWNETATALQGLYRDNYFTQTGASVLTGTVGATGRKMNVILPEAVNGVKSISLTSNYRTSANGPYPIKVATLSNDGETIDSPPVDMALLSAIQESVAQIDSDKCDVGFGVLTGVCGLYDGSFNETSDVNNRCHLLTAGNPRLEIGEDTVIKLYLNYIQGASNQSSHTIGTFPTSPASRNINVTSRYCADLPGTTFSRGNCHTLSLAGDFMTTSTLPDQFVGTYTITDDVTGESCNYSLSVRRNSSI